MVVQATIDSSPMVVLQHQSEGQDGGYRSAQPTDGAFRSEPSGQDLNQIECNICQKRFKKESALSMVSLQVPSREITRPTDGRWGYYFSTYPTHSRTKLALWIAR